MPERPSWGLGWSTGPGMALLGTSERDGGERTQGLAQVWGRRKRAGRGSPGMPEWGGRGFPEVEVG